MEKQIITITDDEFPTLTAPSELTALCDISELPAYTTLDEFIAAMIEIAKECEEKPELLKNAPLNTPVKRVDDTLAVRQLNVKFDW